MVNGKRGRLNMVTSPDLSNLSFVLRQGVKYFELVAEQVERELLPGIWIRGWGYNGSIPGPTIQVYPGDYVHIRVYNALPEATSVHWHGRTYLTSWTVHRILNRPQKLNRADILIIIFQSSIRQEHICITRITTSVGRE